MPTRPDLSRLTVSQLHELTDRDRRWIKRRLATKGVQPVEETARERRYPAREALEAIYLSEERLDPAQEQARLARARAEAVEFDLKIKRREYIPGDDCEMVLVALFSMTQKLLLAVPHRTAPGLAAEGTIPGCYRIVEREIHQALHTLADAAADPAKAFNSLESYLPPRPDEEGEEIG